MDFMINGKLSQFLDTGWYMETTLYYNGYVYWLEAVRNKSTGISEFWVDRWKAKCTDNKYYHSYVDENGEPMEVQRVYNTKDADMDYIKKQFLEARIFQGKNFWEIEKKIAWVEEGNEVSFALE